MHFTSNILCSVFLLQTVWIFQETQKQELETKSEELQRWRNTAKQWEAEVHKAESEKEALKVCIVVAAPLL